MSDFNGRRRSTANSSEVRSLPTWMYNGEDLVPDTRSRVRSLDETQSPERQENAQRLRPTQPASERDYYPGDGGESNRDSQQESAPDTLRRNQADTDNAFDQPYNRWPPKPRSQRVGRKDTEDLSPSKQHGNKPLHILSVANPITADIGSATNPYELQMDHPDWLPLEREFEDIIGHTFICKGLLREAVFPIQTGWARITQGTTDREFQQGNRKLAILGDTLMRSILIDVWLRHQETVATLHRNIRLEINNSRLKAAAENCGMDKLIVQFFPGGVLIGKHVLATTVQAMIGAVWYDTAKKDRAKLRKVMDRLLGTRLDHEHMK